MNKKNLEIQNTIPFTLAPKKYIGTGLSKYMQDLLEENYKTLMYEIKEEGNKRER